MPLFEERPVWSKNAIVGNLNIDNSRLKTILPLFAYYFLTGPWRSLWVRIGYDPRKDPTAKKYQTLDFRVRQMSVDRMPISSKRGTFCYQKPTTVSKTQAQVALIQADDLGVGDAAVASTSTAGTREELEKITSTYTFIPNVLPPFRQMFYQLCDIQAPEVQAIVSRNDNKVAKELKTFT
ncbi:PREDICTED: general transcription factor 3C polypeptide 5-like [Priapulus caudatus]|uniref:General transcription factor 3C polypeptide 5-like n=1 Tax=Priapulus caudatus TaxID=37621 RepID=A0ABM1E1K0_PRICU|nr:PREDICTED: general transcription factor 3C polypeptide 5-like [Priapulus caudatus]